jgi:hypothetical protein
MLRPARGVSDGDYSIPDGSVGPDDRLFALAGSAAATTRPGSYTDPGRGSVARYHDDEHPACERGQRRSWSSTSARHRAPAGASNMRNADPTRRGRPAE